MRFLKKFNENANQDKKYMDKCVSIIEDILLRFEDSGVLISANIVPRVYEPTDRNKITITPKFAQNIVGMKKVKVVDSIINRLRVNFKYVNVLYNECICVWMSPDEHFKEMSNIEDSVNFILSLNFAGLNVKDEEKYLRFYDKDGVKRAVYTKGTKNLFVDNEACTSLCDRTLLQFELGEIVNVVRDYMINEYKDLFTKYPIKNVYTGCQNV